MNRTMKRWAAVTVLGAGLLAGMMVTGMSGTPKAGRGDGETAAPAASGREFLRQLSSAFESAASRVNRSVVPIFSDQEVAARGPAAGQDDPLRNFFGDDFMKRFFGGELPGAGGGHEHVRGLGSGVIVSADGYILTNNHVIDGADKVTVMLQDKKKYEAKIVGRDPQTDLAVVKIDASGLPAADLGNSDSVRVGEWVIAVGNPFQLMHTVTAGIVSATGRSSMQLADYEDFIQTDASINPGNSGGALADLDGRVIGINTAIVNPSGGTGNVGIGFAIPINMARGVMEKLIARGEVARGYLGLVPQDIDGTLAAALGLGRTTGVLVGDVTPDGPAGKAGIRRGDVIEAFNGRSLDGAAGLRTAVADAAPGSTADLTLFRDGRKLDVSVTLGRKPSGIASSPEKDSGRQTDTANDLLGLSVGPLTPGLARELGVEGERGVVATSVTPGGTADEAGLKEGDLIREVNRRPVGSPEEFSKAVAGVKKGDSLALLVSRGGVSFYLGMTVTA